MDEMTQRLLPLLDPSRDYGERSFEEVKEGVLSGTFILEEGTGNLPVIRAAETHLTIRGTSKPMPRNPQEWSKAYIKTRFAGDAEQIYDAMFEAAVKEHNGKAAELLFKYGLGDHRDVGSEAGSKAVEALFALAAANRTEHITVIEGQ